MKNTYVIYHGHNDSWFYTGPLDVGILLAGGVTDHSTNETTGLHEVETSGGDYGVGHSYEEAARYAIGTEFGPQDRESGDPEALALAIEGTQSHLNRVTDLIRHQAKVSDEYLRGVAGLLATLDGLDADACMAWVRKVSDEISALAGDRA